MQYVPDTKMFSFCCYAAWKIAYYTYLSAWPRWNQWLVFYSCGDGSFRVSRTYVRTFINFMCLCGTVETLVYFTVWTKHINYRFKLSLMQALSSQKLLKSPTRFIRRVYETKERYRDTLHVIPTSVPVFINISWRHVAPALQTHEEGCLFIHVVSTLPSMEDLLEPWEVWDALRRKWYAIILQDYAIITIFS